MEKLSGKTALVTGSRDGFGRLVALATNDATAKAVRAATATTPIVWIGGDPVQAGLATSLAHPGGNVTASLFSRGPRSGESACRSSRRPSLRHPRLPILLHASRKLSKDNSFAKQAGNCRSR